MAFPFFITIQLIGRFSMDETQTQTALYNEEEVKRGIALLNEKNPGWREKVNLDTLDMLKVAGCTLGQVYKDYYEGLIELGLSDTDDSAVQYGFQMPGVEAGFGVEDEDYEKLTETWVALLTPDKES